VLCVCVSRACIARHAAALRSARALRQYQNTLLPAVASPLNKYAPGGGSNVGLCGDGARRSAIALTVKEREESNDADNEVRIAS
jgi:hypothetical protein